MIRVEALTKRFGAIVALNELSFEARPGHVTGFLGPNGAGKTTTLRILLGLEAPSAGLALIGERRYRDLVHPLHQVGALLDANAIHPGRDGRHHLESLARVNRIGPRRVTEVLELTGIAEVAARRTKGYSLGMRQRLGIAAAMLGDPPVLILDEPANGLDAEGIHWLRELLISLAARGCTILISSHIMSEMALVADHLVVIGRGQLLANSSMQAFVNDSGRHELLVRTSRPADLAGLLVKSGAQVHRVGEQLDIVGLEAEEVAGLAARDGIPIFELTPQHSSLEQAYLELTESATDYRAGSTPSQSGAET